MSLPVTKGMNFTDMYCIVHYSSSETERVDADIAKKSQLQRREINKEVSSWQGVSEGERRGEQDEVIRQRNRRRNGE